jgi:lipopolysaccharide transport system ATP-binding protein
LLKLITGNTVPTEGSLEVRGAVQALIDAGADFHPEFTGYENMRAALAFQGLTRAEAAEVQADIEEFTELGDFLAQPLKTYSAGMQARLAFATATALRPEVLVVDEVLGAGDAYFISRSTERIRSITESGATVLIVSHSMAHILQLCDRAIWLERGEIIETGAPLDIVRSYEQYVRGLDDQRVRAKNRKRLARGPITDADMADGTAVLTLTAEGSGAACDITEVRLLNLDECIGSVRVGAPQDADATQTGFVVLAGSQWSSPEGAKGEYSRRLAANGSGAASGSVAFAVLFLDNPGDYHFEICYRSEYAPIRAETWRDGERGTACILPATASWHRERVPLEEDASPPAISRAQAVARSSAAAVYHWPGENSLRITHVDLTDGVGNQRAVFSRGDTLALRFRFVAVRRDRFAMLPGIVIYRLDGVNVTTQMGEWAEVDMNETAECEASVILTDLNLGNGNYVISVMLYKSFDPELVEPPTVYDWIDRSIEFKVVGTPPAITSLFEHPSTWKIRPLESEVQGLHADRSNANVGNRVGPGELQALRPGDIADLS